MTLAPGGRGPGPDPAGQPLPAPSSKTRQLLWLALTVLLGVPLLLAGWIALIFLAEQLGWDIGPNQIFAWEIAALVALLLWPLAIRGSLRQFWHNRGRRPDQVAEWGSEPTAPVPTVPLNWGQRLGRVLVMFLGGAGLLAICGPQEVSLLVLHALGAVSVGPNSLWKALQLVTFLLLLALLLPLIALTERSLRKHPKGSQGRFRLEVQQHWYLAAVTAWVICVAMGLMFSWLILAYL
ncbi:hypothetical protein [Arthrobacter sp. NPDC090010]|uniref:hypothetical protein n=1 Tax=Arthrobacter sp. NPDC090010 TaxID=3363942 RepID=UPI003814E56A